MMANTETHQSKTFLSASAPRFASYYDFTSYHYAGLAKLEVQPSH